MGTKAQIAKYTLLPGFWPRIRDFFASGFSYLASLVAVIYYNAGLLPKGHPYTLAENFGRYGLRHVIAEAGNNLVFSRKNIDKIIIYFTVLIGLVILFLQFFLVLSSFAFYPAMATTWYTMFVLRPIPTDQDMSFVVLDKVFGVLNFTGTTGFFGSCISNITVDCLDINGNVISSPAAFPLPFHIALHRMFEFYSFGIAFVGMMILLYCITAIIGETVVSGTPFGQRFSRAWFVPRVIVFFALITPMTTFSGTGWNAGINGAQFITLAAAKFGSNMATRAWYNFHTSLSSSMVNFMASNPAMVAEPTIPEVAQLTQFMFIVRACMHAENIMHGKQIGAYIVRNHDTSTNSVLAHDGTTVPFGSMGYADDYLIYDDGGGTFTRLDEAFKFSRYGTVTLRFGELNPPGVGVNNPAGVNDKDWGYVEPTCGEITIPLISMEPEVVGPLPGALGIQENYYASISEYLWDGDNEFFEYASKCLVETMLPLNQNPACTQLGYTFPAMTPNPNTQWMIREAAKASVEYYDQINKMYLIGRYYNASGNLQTAGGATIPYINANYDFSMPPEIRDRGWAGAALWYNKIAEINGLVVSATQSIPKPFKYPMIMEIIADQHTQYNENSSWTERFNPKLESGKMAQLPRPGDQYIASAFYAAFDFWDEAAPQTTPQTKPTGNAILDAINLMFGTNGLFDIRRNEGSHPLAMLSSMGKSMVDSALQNLFYGAVGQGIGQLFSGNFIGSMGSVASDIFMKFGLITFSIGFVLYYIIPFLPFIYFFFAFAGWIKTIFEAVVAMPLWALAHIKLDGEGLPGPWATNGYFLLFEIFLRPTLIIFGFVASISFFAALVEGLHDAFDLVLDSIGGMNVEAAYTPAPPLVHDLGDMLGPLDELFFTAIYVIIVYMLGMSCFKLVDQVPNNIMRWMGVVVSTFHETAGDPAGELTGRAFRSSQMASAQLTSMIDKSSRVLDTHVQLGMASKPGP